MWMKCLAEGQMSQALNLQPFGPYSRKKPWFKPWSTFMEHQMLNNSCEHCFFCDKPCFITKNTDYRLMNKTF